VSLYAVSRGFAKESGYMKKIRKFKVAALAVCRDEYFLFFLSQENGIMSVKEE